MPSSSQTTRCSPAGAVELRNALDKKFELELPATVTFDYPTIEALSSLFTSALSSSQRVKGSSTQSVTMQASRHSLKRLTHMVVLPCRLAPQGAASSED